ncbi:hypothetical protein PHYBLDRAFT_189600 [Phycomyces blakesleeanus NRRL 1555(-)]|uniref:Uncharacterized protein n=1 Tax=Phycomyces blakesleeanus (strain ATCC 8743b / DSM 1359 / FGSC 10004 / NBRC 33097 / NRRL 1555) TaxID=763407 RepID=A0A162T0A2_PHYB8|nr:hypothetical protein PHYBLDRAFT_189600 [Phycomyces blakesleeanus NRRL 1555(-)]OAD65202.1 hypothetical protein PHYBLDRAFT_189600 [Phycomyces blakesleeanus NRRL 1555(-)]|eukprot:XP_018283242.1 hypothetical protein PHYBLDRAFT_189600 [Phycomyces blakesleeanus NRRL 1555(-)]
MSKPVHSKNEILRSNTGLTINPSKAYSRSETRDKLTGLTIIQGGLFRQSQAIKNRFPSRATGTPRLEEHMLIVFCMLLVPSVQVKHQGSNQSPRLSVSIPSRSSFKVQVKVHGYQYPFHPGKASMFRSPSYGHSFYLLLVSAIQVKCQGPDFPAMGIAIDVRRQGCDLPAKCSVIQVNQQDSDLPSMIIAIDVRRQGCDLPAMCSVIQVNQQDSDLPSMVIAIHVKRPGSDLPTMFTAIRVKRQGPDCPSMVIAIRVKRQGPDCPSMVIAIQVKHQGSTRPSMVCSVIQVKHQGPYRPPMSPAIQVKHQDSDRPSKIIAIQVKHHGSDRPSMVINLIYLQSPAIQIKHQDSDLPAMVIVIHVKHQGSDHPSMVIAIQIKRQGPDHPSMVISIKQHYGHILTSCNILLVFSRPDLIYLQSPAIQVKHQDSDLPAMGIVLNPPRSCFTDPDSVRGYRPNSKDQNSNLGYSLNIKDLISNQVCLRSGYTMKNLFSFQCDRYIHLVRPLVTVGFISLLASQSKPAIMDPISVQCYSVLAVKVPLLSMPMIPNPSPIQSDRATIKDSISIQYDSQGQSIQVYCPLGQTELPKFYYLPSARAEANDQSFDILLGSQQAFNAQLYIKGRRYTRIFKQFTKN